MLLEVVNFNELSDVEIKIVCYLTMLIQEENEEGLPLYNLEYVFDTRFFRFLMEMIFDSKEDRAVVKSSLKGLAAKGIALNLDEKDVVISLLNQVEYDDRTETARIVMEQDMALYLRYYITAHRGKTLDTHVFEDPSGSGLKLQGLFFCSVKDLFSEYECRVEFITFLTLIEMIAQRGSVPKLTIGELSPDLTSKYCQEIPVTVYRCAMEAIARKEPLPDEIDVEELMRICGESKEIVYTVKDDSGHEKTVDYETFILYLGHIAQSTDNIVRLSLTELPRER